jgi:hypothetical protein
MRRKALRAVDIRPIPADSAWPHEVQCFTRGRQLSTLLGLNRG